jgi:hypothetical protein
MLIRAKSGIAIALLLTSIILLFGGANRALAHAGHDHGSAADTSIQASVVVDAEQFLPVDNLPGLAGAELTGTPTKPSLPLHQANCCCGSVACHAGVAGAHMDISHPYDSGERLALRLEVGLIKAGSDGIERPPRAHGSR